MKKIIQISLLFFLLLACRQEKKEKFMPEPETTLIDTAQINIVTDSTQKPDKQQDSIKSGDFFDTYPPVLKELAPKFYFTNLRRYDCTDIEAFVPDRYNPGTENLVKIDSILGQKIFDNNTSSEYGRFEDFYLFSLENPILDFYPITIVQPLGVAERPMLLLLFDKDGKYINNIEVADAYGETGGCLNSFFINDSTLVREFEWNEIMIDKNGEDEIIVKKENDTLIIHKDGSYSSLNEIREKQAKEREKRKIHPDLYYLKWEGKDTLVSLDFLTNKRFASLEFNYPKLPSTDTIHQASSPDERVSTFGNDTIIVELKEIKYHPDKHSFKTSSTDSSILIDNNPAYGIDYGARESEMKSEIESIKIIKGDQTYLIPKKYYNNWFNAGFSGDENIYMLPGNRIIIDFMGSDGAGAYRAGIIIKDNKVLKKLTYTGW